MKASGSLRFLFNFFERLAAVLAAALTVVELDVDQWMLSIVGTRDDLFGYFNDI